MTPVWLIVGLLLVIWVLVDALWTTLWAGGGAGPMTKRLAALLWRAAKWIARLGGEGIDHDRLSVAGPLIMGVTIGVWLVLLWVGFTLVFTSAPGAVVDSITGRSAGFGDRIWYTLYVTTTLGNGDLAPEGLGFQILTGLAATAGLAVLTLSLTYSLSVLDAVNAKRSLAGDIFALDGSVGGTLKMLESGDRGGIENRLSSISSEIVDVALSHEAYPIVHYFHTRTARESAACAIAQLDETLTLYVDEMREADGAFIRTTVEPTRRSITTFLKTFRTLYVTEADQPPSLPDVGQLERAGVEISADAIEQATGPFSDRRRLLAGVVDEDGWRWDEVVYQRQRPEL